MSQTVTSTCVKQPVKRLTFEDMMSSMKLLTSPAVPKNKVFVINEDEFWGKSFFEEAFDKLNKKVLKDWVWCDFTRLRPETIHKIRKCRKLSLAKRRLSLTAKQ